MSKVAIVQHVGCLEREVRRVIELIGGIKAIIKPGGLTVIKPNVLAARCSATGATTSPDLVGIIARLCYEAGTARVVVAESANWGVDTLETMRSCGFFDLTQRERVELFDLKRGEFLEVSVPGYVHQTVRIPRLLAEADSVINIPVLKTHSMSKVTLGLKNLSVGISSDYDKQCNLHRIGIFEPLPPHIADQGSFLDHAIVDINLGVRCDLTVIDGLVGMEGFGAPLMGTPAHANLIIAGTDRLAVDCVGTRIIGYSPEEINHLVLARNKRLGEFDIDKIDIFGERLENCVRNLERTFNPLLVDVEDTVTIVDWGGTCDACRSMLNYTLTRHQRELLALSLPVTIFVGNMTNHFKPSGEKRLYIHYGNCSARSIYGGGFVPGCPPRSRRQLLQAIGAMDLYDGDEGLNSLM